MHQYTIESLRTFLESHNIPLERWGVGKANSIEKLLKELNEGECSLRVANGQIIRHGEGAGLIIYFRNSDQLLRLREQCQILKHNGHRRTRPMIASVAEKMRPGEKPEVAIYRAHTEELGICEVIPVNYLYLKKTGPLVSTSYPGFLSKSTIHFFNTYLEAKHFRPGGYVEEQPDKTNYYEWEREEFKILD
jgi:hypothetical protein